jgi:hypothetical protein
VDPILQILMLARAEAVAAIAIVEARDIVRLAAKPARLAARNQAALESAVDPLTMLSS